MLKKVKVDCSVNGIIDKEYDPIKGRKRVEIRTGLVIFVKKGVSVKEIKEKYKNK